MCPASIPALASTKHAALLDLSDDGKQIMRAYRNICIKQKQFAKDRMFKRKNNVADFFLARLPSSCESVLCSSSSQPTDYKSNLEQYDSEASHFASAENIAVNASMKSSFINKSLHSSYSNISNDPRDTVQDINISLKYPDMLVYDTVSCSPQKFNSSLNSHKNELDSDSLFRPGQNLDKEMTISLSDTVSQPNIFETCDGNLFQKQQISEATSEELWFTRPGGSKLYSSSSKSKNDLALSSFTENNSEKRNPDISECAETIVPTEISCNINFSLGFGSQLEYSLDHSKADVDET